MAAKVPCLVKKIYGGKFYDILRVQQRMRGRKSFLGHVHFHVSALHFKIKRLSIFLMCWKAYWVCFPARGTLSLSLSAAVNFTDWADSSLTWIAVQHPDPANAPGSPRGAPRSPAAAMLGQVPGGSLAPPRKNAFGVRGETEEEDAGGGGGLGTTLQRPRD